MRLSRRRRSPEKLAQGGRPGGTHQRVPVDEEAQVSECSLGPAWSHSRDTPLRGWSRSSPDTQRAGSEWSWHCQWLWGGQGPCLKALEKLCSSQFPSQDGTWNTVQGHRGACDMGRMLTVQTPALCSRGHFGSGSCWVLERSSATKYQVGQLERVMLSGRATHWQAEVNANSHGGMVLEVLTCFLPSPRS